MNTDQLPFAPACERNKQPILEILRQVLPRTGTVLEIGSGTGQHVVYFARRLAGLNWQPSEQAEYLDGLCARLEIEGCDSISAPLELDVSGDWPTAGYAAVITANTAHIMSWQEVVHMFDGVQKVLEPGGVFCLYGPFNIDGAFTSESNRMFDLDLKARKASMGLRDLKDLESLAVQRHMTLEQRFDMPANNQILVFRKLTS